MIRQMNSLVVRFYVAVGVAIICCMSQAFAQTLRSTIPLESFAAWGDMGGIVINPVTNRIYVLGFNPNNELALKVIDATTNSSIASILGIPSGFAYFMTINTQTNRLHVFSRGDVSTVMTVIDGNTNAIIATISLPYFQYL